MSNWGDVAHALNNRMGKLKVSAAELSRRSGVSETTIRYARRGLPQKHSTLEALGATLRLPVGYLWAIAQEETPDESPGTSVANRLAVIERKLDALCNYQLPPSLRSADF